VDMKTGKFHKSQPIDNERNSKRKVTGRELSEIEEVTTRLNVLLKFLDERGVININEFNRIVAMRLHETSKATAFEELEEEL
jgi:hypothetical protein